MFVAYATFIIVAGVLALMDLKPDFQSGSWAVAVPYLVLDVLAAALILLEIMGVPLVGPSEFITRILGPIVPPLG